MVRKLIEVSLKLIMKMLTHVFLSRSRGCGVGLMAEGCDLEKTQCRLDDRKQKCMPGTTN